MCRALAFTDRLRDVLRMATKAMLVAQPCSFARSRSARGMKLSA
jgi:hypothetical protein